MKRWSTAAIVVSVVSLAIPNPVSAQGLYLELDGITGESVAQGFEGAIEVEAVGASSQTQPGRARGAPMFGPLNVTKKVDRATDDLLERLWTGRVIAQGALVWTQVSGGGLIEVVRIGMRDVRVAAYDVSGDGEQAVEQIRLEFGQVWHSYRPIGNDGSPGDPECSGWDVPRNRPFSCPSS